MLTTDLQHVSKDYIASKKRQPPAADRIVELYEKVFLSKMGQCKKADDKYDIVWFLKYVASVVSHQTELGKRTKKVNYQQAVTPTDEAFALMALEHHKSKWTNEQTASNEGQGEKKKKRITGSVLSESRRYYSMMTKKMGEIRKGKAEKYSAGEQWLQEEAKRLLGSEGSEGKPEAEPTIDVVDISGVVDSGVSLEMEMNPFLDGGEVEIV